MADRTPGTDPFRPIGWIVQILLGFLAASIVLGLAAATYVGIVGVGTSSLGVYEFGGGPPCLVLDDDDLQLGGSELPPRDTGAEGAPTRVDGDAATVYASAYRVCLEDASLSDRAVLSAPGFVRLVTAFVALLLLHRVIRSGRARGLFTPEIASRLAATGWFLLASAVVLPATDVWAEIHVIRAADPGNPVVSALLSPPIPMVLVLTALGVLAMARVLRRSVALQEEVDATV